MSNMKTLCLSKIVSDLKGKKLLDVGFGFAHDEPSRKGAAGKVIIDSYIDLNQSGDAVGIWLKLMKHKYLIFVYENEELTVE